MEFLRNMARRYEEEEEVTDREPTPKQAHAPAPAQTHSSYVQSPYGHNPQQAFLAPFQPHHLDPRFQLVAHQAHQARTPLSAHFSNNVGGNNQDVVMPRSVHWQGQVPQQHDYARPHFQFSHHPGQTLYTHQPHQFYYQQPLPYGHHIPVPRLPVPVQRPSGVQEIEATSGPRLYLHPGDATKPKSVPNPFDIAESQYRRRRSKSSSVRGSSVAARKRNGKSLSAIVTFEDNSEGQAASVACTPQMSPQMNAVSKLPHVILRSSSPAAGGKSYDAEDETSTMKARTLVNAGKGNDNVDNTTKLAHPVPLRKPQLRSAKSSKKHVAVNHSEVSPVATSSPLPPKRVWPTVSSATRPSRIVKLKYKRSLIPTRILGSSVPKKGGKGKGLMMPPPPTPRQRDFVPPTGQGCTPRKTLPKPQAVPEARMQTSKDDEQDRHHKYSTRASRGKSDTSPIPTWALAPTPPIVVHPAGTISPRDIHINAADPLVPKVTVKEDALKASESSKLSESLKPKVAGYAHGSQVRGYMNKSLTPHLLDGMKWIARNQPSNPIHWLGAFLLRRSAVMEGTTDSTMSDEESDEDDDEDEDPDADGEPDLEHPFTTMPIQTHNENRSWSPESETQNQTSVIKPLSSSSFSFGDSLVEGIAQDADVQMGASNNHPGDDEVGHEALLNMGMEVDGMNESSLHGLGFGDEGILADDAGDKSYGVVW